MWIFLESMVVDDGECAYCIDLDGKRAVKMSPIPQVFVVASPLTLVLTVRGLNPYKRRTNVLPFGIATAFGTVKVDSFSGE